MNDETYTRRQVVAALKKRGHCMVAARFGTQHNVLYVEAVKADVIRELEERYGPDDVIDLVTIQGRYVWIG